MLKNRGESKGSMNIVLSIAAGGALGAVIRHFINVGMGIVTPFNMLPLGVFVVNIIGSFLMGVVVAAFANGLEVSQSIRAFLTVGLLGGFTTFSAFSFEAVKLIEKQALGLAAIYIGASVVLSVLSLFAGLWIVRGALS